MTQTGKDEAHRPRVVIVGAGFGGLYVDRSRESQLDDYSECVASGRSPTGTAGMRANVILLAFTLVRGMQVERSHT